MEIADARFNDEYDGEDFTFDLNGTKLMGQTWVPKNEAKFIYVLAHGLALSIVSKKDLFYVILDNDGVVFGCDHLGHGRSAGARASCVIEEVVEETVRVITIAHERYPNLPLILHGHSMGGLASILIGLTKFADVRNIVSGVIAEVPWLSPCPQRPIGRLEQMGLRMLTKVWPTFYLNSGVEMVTDDIDPRWGEMCKRNSVSKLTPRLLMSVQAAQGFVQANANEWPSALPLLFLQGDIDTIVAFEGNDKWARSLVAREDVDITYKIYEGVGHFTLKTAKRGDVIRDILAFVGRFVNIQK